MNVRITGLAPGPHGFHLVSRLPPRMNDRSCVLLIWLITVLDSLSSCAVILSSVCFTA